jgi:hypothetical protein
VFGGEASVVFELVVVASITRAVVPIIVVVVVVIFFTAQKPLHPPFPFSEVARKSSYPGSE